MTREPLPHRRASWTLKVRIGVPAQTFFLSCGEYPDGRPGEIWLEASKEGTFTRGIIGSLARMASLALQNGVPVAEVVLALRGLNFSPHGPVEGSAAVTHCSSLADFVAQEIAAVYLTPVPPVVEKGAGVSEGAGF